jgi:serine/threonine-protein kinase
VKVLDFGIAKELDGAGEGLAGQALTRSSALLGSPLYMSPEQMRSARDVDARSDIWSLGAVLYELLTGKVPFEAQSFGELCMHVVQRSAAPLVEHRADLPPELGAVVLRCLEKEPGARYQDVAQLAAALSPFAPARARPLAARVAAISAAIAAPPSSGRQVGAASDAGAAIGPAPSASGATPPGSGRIPVDTHGSWGATGPGAAPRSRRRWAGALAAALAALALGGFLLQRAMSPGAASTKAATLLAGVGLAIAPAAGAVAQSADRDLLVVPAGGAPPPTGAQPAAQPGGEGSAKAAAPRPAPSPGGASKRPSNARPGTAAPRAAQVPDFGGRK